MDDPGTHKASNIKGYYRDGLRAESPILSLLLKNNGTESQILFSHLRALLNLRPLLEEHGRLCDSD